MPGSTSNITTCPLPDAAALFKRKLNREWGHHIARGWASLLLDRPRDYVGNTAFGPAHQKSPESLFGPGASTALLQYSYYGRHNQGANHGRHGA